MTVTRELRRQLRADRPIPRFEPCLPRPAKDFPLRGQKVIRSHRSLLFFLIVGLVPASTQDPGTLNPEPLPPLSNPNSPSIPAKELFARKTMPLPGLPRSIGSYADGCLAGAVALPISGPIWQVMRVSRNRYWGNPSLVAFIKRLADHAKEVGWNGLIVGDMSQPRGGPMLSGHSSHQIGLDVDIWFTPMPDHELSPEEREFNMALNMVAKDRRDVDPAVWTHERTATVRAAAQDPVVTRIFVNAAIKKAMCREVGSGRSWLSKVRRGGDTTNIFTSASRVHPTAANASRNRQWVQVTDVGTSLIPGSKNPCCIGRRRLCRNTLSP